MQEIPVSGRWLPNSNKRVVLAIAVFPISSLVIISFP
jgi:hypothetical protein